MNASETKTVLCVEDNPVNLFLVEAIFESRSNIKLLTATLGTIALQLARDHRPNLILLDLNLPDMDGAEYLEKLRAVPELAHIPVVIVSADAMNEQRVHFLSLGVADYITKPFDLEQFEKVVDRCLGLG